MHLIGRGLALATGIPWIADFRDPWTKIFYFKHLSMTRGTEKWHKKMEQKVLDDATVVVAVSPLVQQEFQAMTQTPVQLITNGFDECDFAAEKSHMVGGGPEQGFCVTHTGLFAADGNPTMLWEVLAEKCNVNESFRKALKIKLIGKTDDSILAALEKAGLSEAVDNVGYLHHSEAVEQQRNASLLILPLRKEPEYKAVLPGKLFEYLASRRPVLGIGQPDGAMAMILNETKTGVVLDWEDREAIAQFIDSCWEKHLAGELAIDGADISQFTRRNLARRMAQLFEETINS
jgi:glycosyltransferase involved in cell wall biosynthesis